MKINYVEEFFCSIWLMCIPLSIVLLCNQRMGEWGLATLPLIITGLILVFGPMIGAIFSKKQRKRI